MNSTQITTLFNPFDFNAGNKEKLLGPVPLKIAPNNNVFNNPHKISGIRNIARKIPNQIFWGFVMIVDYLTIIPIYYLRIKIPPIPANP
jgi:hypothetical protein